MRLGSLERKREEIAKETLHIATFGDQDKDAILIGIKYLPITKLILITLENEREKAVAFASQLGRTLKLEVEIQSVSKPILYNTILLFKEIIMRHLNLFDDIVVNASSGDKLLGCAAITAAFINGLKTIAIDDGMPILLPIIRFSYSEVISDAKMKILKALQDVGGMVKDLTELSRMTGFGKPLLSYHINGSDESRGLVDLGLIEVVKNREKGLNVKITEMGRMLLAGMAFNRDG